MTELSKRAGTFNVAEADNDGGPQRSLTPDELVTRRPRDRVKRMLGCSW